MEKKIQVVMLPTNKKSENGHGLLLRKDIGLRFPPAGGEYRRLYNNDFIPQHLYFLSSDEEIKEGSWFIDLHNLDKPKYCDNHKLAEKLNIKKEQVKKVIATTDESLKVETYFEIEGNQKVSLPQPSQEFIQYYVEQKNKGYIIEWVHVGYEGKYPFQYELGKKQEILKINSDNTIRIILNPVKDLSYWKSNAEEDYITTPISVLKYISELESFIEKINSNN